MGDPGLLGEDQSRLTLPLVERFYSIQGEGALAGWPAYFIRYAGCNLDCAFADGAVCDTPWQKAREHPLLDHVVEEAEELLPPRGWVILTGGEPTIQPTLPALVEKLYATGLNVSVESNATRWHSCLDRVDWLVASPKHLHRHRSACNATPDPEYMASADELRVVVTAETPVTAYSGSFPEIIDHRYVSPATLSDGSGETGFKGFAPGAVERAMLMVQERGWRMSVQMHKMLGVR